MKSPTSGGRPKGLRANPHTKLHGILTAAHPVSYTVPGSPRCPWHDGPQAIHDGRIRSASAGDAPQRIPGRSGDKLARTEELVESGNATGDVSLSEVEDHLFVKEHARPRGHVPGNHDDSRDGLGSQDEGLGRCRKDKAYDGSIWWHRNERFGSVWIYLGSSHVGHQSRSAAVSCHSEDLEDTIINPGAQLRIQGILSGTGRSHLHRFIQTGLLWVAIFRRP